MRLFILQIIYKLDMLNLNVPDYAKSEEASWMKKRPMGLEDEQIFYKMQKRKVCVGMRCERAGGGEIHNEFTWGV